MGVMRSAARSRLVIELRSMRGRRIRSPLPLPSASASASSCSATPSSSRSSLRDRLISDAESAALQAASSSGKVGRKRGRTAASVARKNATAFWDRYNEAFGGRWEGLCRAMFEEDQQQRVCALVNELAFPPSPSPVPSLESSTERSGGIGVDFERVTERILCEVAAATGEATPIERVPWLDPLLAIWANEGAVRLPPPSSYPVDSMDAELQDNKESHQGLDRSALFSVGSDRSLLDYYCLDPSSLLPVLALGLHEPPSVDDVNGYETPVVLDMCAAPGGKTLALAQLILGPSSGWSVHPPILVANEPSRSRRERLRRVLDMYVPRHSQVESVRVTGMDGAHFGRTSFGRRMYDAMDQSSLPQDSSTLFSTSAFTHILCDVPCSGERHLLSGGGGAVAKWRPGSGRANRKRQEGLLKAAIASCRPEGVVVYATCSIDPAENDGVVGRVLKKRAGSVLSASLKFEIGEEAEYGWMVFPDNPTCRGMGPMYIAKLSKAA